MRPARKVRRGDTDDRQERSAPPPPERAAPLLPAQSANRSPAHGFTAAQFASARPRGPGVSKPVSPGGPEARPSPADRELLAKRDRLVERFAAMQLDLGGVYYEMAIRDHMRSDVLTRKAAEMQRVDAELRQVEGVLDRGGSGAHKCPACDALYAPGAAFCSQCGGALAAGAAGANP